MIDRYSNLPAVQHVIEKDACSTDGEVYGIASLGDTLFVLRGGASPIDVYNTTTFKKTHQLVIPRKQGAAGLADCQYYKSLYISDDSSKRIHGVNLSDYSRFEEWSSQTDVAVGLFVTKETITC